jgi:hypothetical protein
MAAETSTIRSLSHTAAQTVAGGMGPLAHALCLLQLLAAAWLICTCLIAAWTSCMDHIHCMPREGSLHAVCLERNDTNSKASRTRPQERAGEMQAKRMGMHYAIKYMCVCVCVLQLLAAAW